MIEERIAFLKRLLGDWPRFVPTYLNLTREGIRLLEQNMPTAAEQYFEGAIKSDRANPITYELLAFSLLAQKTEREKERAIEIFGSLINADSYRNLMFSFEGLTYNFQDVDSYRNLAFAIAMYGKHHHYVTLLKDALKHKPDDDLLIRIGRISVTQGITDLTGKVQQAMQKRDLNVKLYPL